MKPNRILLSLWAGTGLGLAMLAAPALAADHDTRAVLTTYSDIAHATYEDSLTTARALRTAVDTLVKSPSDATLEAARLAWIAARAPYQQTEAFRFGNPLVDDWEGRVNSWPLDEDLIDYVDGSYGTESDQNSLYTANVIAARQITVDGQTVDVTTITPDVVRSLQEAGGIEANVTTGYHAIEFLLWGQDLNGNGPGAGNRPATDFDPAKRTNGNCDRRAAFLQSAAALLVADLEEMVGNWGSDGAARAALMDGEANAGLAAILTGMGSLSYGELAGERMKLGLLLHDPEEEHDCFSDNTHASHLNDAIGIRNVYRARYKRVDGSEIVGPSLSEVVKSSDPALDAEINAKLDRTVAAMEAIAAKAAAGESYDQQIAEGNAEGNARIQAAIDALIDQTKSIERAVATLKLDAVAFEGSDSLDNPNAVFQ